MPTPVKSSSIQVLGLPQNIADHLQRANITTVGTLCGYTRTAIAESVDPAGMAAIDAALVKYNLEWAHDGGVANACKTCPRCDVCGNPRATSASAVVQGFDGRYKHNGFQSRPTCDDCHEHHGAFFPKAAAS